MRDTCSADRCKFFHAHVWPSIRRAFRELVVAASAWRLRRWLEKDLEKELAAHLALPGQDLLLIGRQVKIFRGLVDLLAIDSTGTIYIIEVKLNQARPSSIGQVLSYRRAVKRLNREKIIRIVANGKLEIDLVESFRLHFGYPLPETVNEFQVLVIVAKSIHPQTAYSILELREEAYSVPVTTFRYVREPDAIKLVPCCQDDQDVEKGSHLDTTQPAPLDPANALRNQWRRRRPIDEDIRRFWLTNAQDFGPFVTFGFIFDRYEEWLNAQQANGVRPRNKGLLGEQVRAITEESNEWSRVWVARRADMAPYNTIVAPPSVRSYRALDHSVVAYQRNPISRAQGA
ncbi:DUF91 domain-containing protein [Arthrobacter echini]|uniref:DUF91 domain-containing protein n=1 Tax=Arthrobacter echini TaxID=1529066 RepID=A0A5D0XHE2_9MICC|nr:endonuclease NucS domain-containing protein [Arthrobacter echini]TYC95855.1 DUF91 domain-containing protein [Arthrobacter echini]